jgi:hypothetical protein
LNTNGLDIVSFTLYRPINTLDPLKPLSKGDKYIPDAPLGKVDNIINTSSLESPPYNIGRSKLPSIVSLLQDSPGKNTGDFENMSSIR